MKMATSTVRRVFNYFGVILLILLLGVLLFASYQIMGFTKFYYIFNHIGRATMTTDNLSESSSTLCHSSFMASHKVLRSYVCSDLPAGELPTRDVPQIVPPLLQTGCENLTDLDRFICNGQFLRTVILIATISAAIMAGLLSLLVIWTVASWIVTVRPSYLRKKAAQFARAMDKSRRSGGIIGTEESLEEGTMKYPQLKERPQRIAQKYATFRGVGAMLPWGKGSEWRQAEVEVVRRGIMPGFMVGMAPPQIDLNVIQPGELERGDFFERFSGNSGSEETGSNATTRVVSTGHESTRLGPMEVRKRSGLGDGFPKL